jgi:8-oxo-dGTP diphosphatase
MCAMVHSDMPTFPPEFYASLPAKHVAAACLFLDENGRVLLVKPAYKEPWELPGGGVEAGESPFDACRREITEELGLNLAPQRLLGVDYRRAVEGVRGDALRFVFCGGVLSRADMSQIRLNTDELSEWRFVALEQLDDLVIPAMAHRIRAFVGDPHMTYLEEGRSPERR